MADEKKALDVQIGELRDEIKALTDKVKELEGGGAAAPVCQVCQICQMCQICQICAVCRVCKVCKVCKVCQCFECSCGPCSGSF